MNEVEKYKKELAKALYCGDRYGDSCDCDCKACLEDTLDALTNFENLVRTDERTEMLMPYDVESIDDLIENVRAKMLDEVIDIVSIACKFDEDNKAEMKQYILKQLKKLKTPGQTCKV